MVPNLIYVHNHIYSPICCHRPIAFYLLIPKKEGFMWISGEPGVVRPTFELYPDERKGARARKLVDPIY